MWCLGHLPCPNPPACPQNGKGNETCDTTSDRCPKHSGCTEGAPGEPYAQCYRNRKLFLSVQLQAVCDHNARFRDGLSTLDVIHALEQHPSVFRPYMCYSVDRLKPESLEGVFKAQLSEAGSTRRQEETRILGYWRDYLLDTGEQETGVSLQDILMFATGLNSLPPSTIMPQPQLSFEKTSKFPIASTCANTIKLPISKSYEEFKNAMDFGIQNSPGFGLR
ncbi:hypothetical protein QQF64_033936 [Cirrhinus molitorella]|uniref:HECT domain-containing protein n=1 Tax=Cirrhinus molitorella TaxID=172907 RepID=A0ABR3MVB2_9TELE